MAATTDNVANISWLIGKWKSTEATASFPTMKPFPYKEEIVFTHIGQPMLNFNFRAWNPENDKPMHLERGFLKVQAGTDHVAFICAQNVGLVEIEEGEVSDKEICLESKAVGRVSFASEPSTQKISRKFKLLDGNKLEQTVSMATKNNPDLTPHLHAVYEKCDD